MSEEWNVGTVQNAYLGVWNAFTDAAAAQNLQPKSHNDLGIAISPGKHCRASALFVLKGWPYKAVSSSKGKALDVVVRVEEKFASNFSSIIKCSTQIGYFRPRAGKHDRVLEMHYDFENPVQEAHPVFHAQIGSTSWPLADLAQMGLPLSLSADAAPSTYGNTRIPTAYMGFGQVLLSLAADHFQPKGYRRVAAAVRERLPKLPPISCDGLDAEVSAGVFPHVHHWYEHRYVAEVSRKGPNGPWFAKIPLLGNVYGTGKTRADAENDLIRNSNLSRAQIKFR